MSAERSERSPADRREVLKDVLAQARGCVRCPELAATRRTVVFGAGHADAELMLVGEAPGASEDEQGIPFVGRAGRLLEKLLLEIGLSRSEVFIANVLKCLRHDALVQLGDGSWEPIGGLVRSRYDGEVISAGPEGELLRARVTDWHATPLGGRSVYQLRRRSGAAPADVRGVALTGDHPVLTERGYVPVQALARGERIAMGEGAPGGAVGRERAESPVGGPGRVLYEEVEVEELTARQEQQTPFFCLDVEGTHNFLTAGGVVHNCRPPGNRDPLPAEIENCQEYLLRQVELIQPSVICTLGNFSTKLLRADPTGITRLHGRPEVILLGGRAVRLYPIYHPAAALYTPRMLETLREDFSRLPDLLALGAPEQPPASAEPRAPLAPRPPIAQPPGARVELAAPEAQGPPGELAADDQLGLF